MGVESHPQTYDGACQVDRDLIAARLKSVREAARLTQAEFAEELAVPVATYKQWEQGRYDVPAAAFFALERTRNVNPSWLFNGTGPVHGRNRPARPIGDEQAESIVFKVYRRWSDRLNISADQLDSLVEFGKEIARRAADRAIANAPN